MDSTILNSEAKKLISTNKRLKGIRSTWSQSVAPNIINHLTEAKRLIPEMPLTLSKLPKSEYVQSVTLILQLDKTSASLVFSLENKKRIKVIIVYPQTSPPTPDTHLEYLPLGEITSQIIIDQVASFLGHIRKWRYDQL